MKRILAILFVILLLTSGCKKQEIRLAAEDYDAILTENLPIKETEENEKAELKPEEESKTELPEKELPEEPASTKNVPLDQPVPSVPEEPDPKDTVEWLYGQEFHMDEYPLEELPGEIYCFLPTFHPFDKWFQELNPEKDIIFLGQKSGKSKMGENSEQHLATTPIKVITPLYGDIRTDDVISLREYAYVLSHNGTLITHSNDAAPVIQQDEIYLFCLTGTPGGVYCEELSYTEQQRKSFLNGDPSRFSYQLINHFLGESYDGRLDLFNGIDQMTEAELDPQADPETWIEVLTPEQQELIRRLIDQYGAKPCTVEGTAEQSETEQ